MKLKKLTKIKQFTWSGINMQGNAIAGEISAATLNLAKCHLAKQGITIRKIQKKSLLALKKRRKKISYFDITLFFRQLATLISSGVPIVQCLEILRESQTNFEFQTVIAALKTNIIAGKSLSTALRQFPHYFDDLTYYLLHAGEQSGTFAIMLSRIASHREKVHYFKSNIKQALFYPGIICMIAMIISLIMLTLIVPRFAEIFQQTQQSLPAFTLYVIYISDFVRHYGWLGLVFIFCIVPMRSYFKKSDIFKQTFERIVLKTPIAKSFLQKQILANFAGSFATTIAAGMPIIDAIKMIAHTSGNIIYRQALLQLQSEISKGKQLHRSMQKNQLFPSLVVQMVKVGEESGMLDQMLEKIALIYQEDIDHFVNNISQVLEPLIMVVLGVLIGGLVIAMYLPVFKLGTVM